MKKLIYSLSFVLILHLTLKIENSQCQWVQQTNPLDSNNSTGKIQFVSSTEGWISSNKSLFHTTNGGTNWTVVTPFPNDTAGSITDPAVTMWWVNQSRGWKMCIIGTSFSDARGAVMHQTTDGGNTWQKKILSTTVGEVGLQVQFLDANTGYASIYNSSFTSIKLMKSTNGGNNWNLINTSFTDVGEFYFVDANNGWSIPGGLNATPPYTITHTTNGGVNWSVQFTDNLVGRYSHIQFTDLNNGWVAGRNRKILKTNNGGANWIPINNTGLSDTAAFSKSLFFINANTGWIGESYYVPPPQQTPLRVILRTSNGGGNWSEQIPSFLTWRNAVFSIYFNDAYNGWFTTDYSMIGHTINGGSIGINQISEVVPSSFSLNQNYPNPFNPSTVISFQLPVVSLVTLKVYDLLGREVQTLVNESLKPGTYEAAFDGTQLTSGVYFYNLISDSYTETKKMILMK